MTESAYAAGDEQFDEYGDEFDDGMPNRPRRQFLNRWSAGVVAVLLGAIGFFVGVHVEKSKVGGTGTSAASALAAHFTSSSKATKGSATKTKGSGFAFPSGGATAAGGTAGTVTSVDGGTIYVKETDGNTVKVKLSSATTITKTETVGKGKVYPGDSVTISGSKGSGGSVEATSVTDSGASSSSSTTSGTSSSSSGSSSSAISSLFGGG